MVDAVAEKKVASLEEVVLQDAPPRARQTMAFDSFDELPEEIQDAAKKLDHALVQWQGWASKYKEYRADLTRLMHDHKIKHVPAPSDDDKVFTLKSDEPKEKLVKVPRSKAGLDDAEE